MSKIAFATDTKDGLQAPISQHFGRCACFIVLDVGKSDDSSFEVYPNAAAENHNPGDVPNLIKSFGANTIVSGGMGYRAKQFFEDMGIQCVVGAAGTVGQVVEQIRSGDFVLPETNDCPGCSDEHKH